MFDGGIETVPVPVINLMSDSVVHTAAVPLPVGISINQNSSSGNFLFFLRGLEKIVDLDCSGREADLTEDGEVISDAISLDDFETEFLFGDIFNRDAERFFKCFWIILLQKGCGFFVEILTVDDRYNTL